METMRPLKGAAWMHPTSTSWPLHQGSRSLACARRTTPQSISCTLGSALAPLSLPLSQTCSFASPLRRTVGHLHGWADSIALPQRRSSTIATRSTSDEISDADVEDVTRELEKEAEESKATYSEAVDSLKQEILKVQGSAKEAYEPRAEKAVEVLRDSKEKLKVEAEKARAALTATAFDTVELGKSNLNQFAENAPDPIKEIAESAVNAHLKENIKQGAKIHDFCLGIPYGAFLVAGGLLWFIITGSTDALRFGVVLGGIILALSVTSLRIWKEGKSSIPYIQGQAAIAFIIFVKDSRRFFEIGGTFPRVLTVVASAGMLAFYAYVYLSGGNPPKKAKVSDAIA